MTLVNKGEYEKRLPMKCLPDKDIAVFYLDSDHQKEIFSKQDELDYIKFENIEVAPMLCQK